MSEKGNDKGLSWYKHREWQPGDDAAPVAEPQKVKQSVEASPTGSHSAWNSAGTWEEQGQKTWAVSSLNERLEKLEGPGAKVKSVTITGDASINFIRGKKKYPFDFKLEFKISCSDDLHQCEVEIPDFACDETAPYEMDFTWKGDSREQKFKEAVGASSKQVNNSEGLMAKVHTELEAWIEDFKKR
eukprot:TRINITY_DN12336_c0_g1_i1.p1 TRINITY_DN12336_c0_g1~~TRINITY_DN12336_c0_g1_i1.p1  ORF type:complete len:205 (+),score=60.63 TRINITY_DN12336_c0_g1_i1:59-616(+)